MKVAVYRNALDIEVYRTCINSLKTHVAIPGVVGDSLGSARRDEARKADVRFLRKTGNPDSWSRPLTELHDWLSKFMEPYGDLVPETANVITYKEGDYYKWHRDGSGTGYRKYSFISVLSPRDQYEGGELELDGITLPDYAFDPLSIIVFNPSIKHRVKPVTAGIRHSLVSWLLER